MTPPGPNLALLLLGGYRALVDATVAELGARGFGEVSPTLAFAMRAIDAGANSASDLGRRLSVTKQGAARTIEVLLERGLVVREQDPEDGRRKRLAVTPRGAEVMRVGEEIFNALREDFAKRIGPERLEELERDLAVLVGDGRVRPEAPGPVGL